MKIDHAKGEIVLLGYRYCTDTFKGEWMIALEPSEADEALAQMNEESDGKWTLETHPIIMWIQDAKRISATVAGQKTSIRKKVASRANGAKGGRPKGSKNKPK